MKRLSRLTLGLACAATAVGQPPQAAKESPIQDNSFLVEEAYNQEAGVVQHASTFNRLRNGKDWNYTFTQEWPVLSQKHQFSYTVPLLRTEASPDGRAGLGDIALTYRYQMLGSGETELALSPRVTVLPATGKYRQSRGVGATSWQAQLPVSWVITDSLVSHSNVGLTLTPRGRDAGGNRADLSSWNVGQSLVWLVHSRFNFLVEWVHASSQSVAGPGAKSTERSTYLSPGIRWAHDLASGMQIVPGIAVPIGVGPSRHETGIFLYLSFEHPFGRK